MRAEFSASGEASLSASFTSTKVLPQIKAMKISNKCALSERGTRTLILDGNGHAFVGYVVTKNYNYRRRIEINDVVTWQLLTVSIDPHLFCWHRLFKHQEHSP